MKPYLLALQTAVFFALIIIVVLTATLALFVHVAGQALIVELGSLRAYQGLEVVELLESHLAAGRFDDVLTDPEARRLLETAAAGRGFDLRLQRIDDFAASRAHRQRVWTVEVQGRECEVLGPPVFETWVPVIDDGRRIASLVVRDPLHSRELHEAFHSGLLRIGGIALLCATGLAIYVTAPLRRMSRSMDRVAAGDLEHRVTVRGSNEVAVMGRSFNTMADRIQAMLKGQKELIAGVSHELRSPLTRMKLALELLRGGTIEKQKIDHLEAEIDILEELVAELLLASRFDLGTVPLTFEVLEVADLAREAWTRVADLAADKGITLALELSPDATTVRADRSLMVRVFGNLFENAVRYAGRGAVTVSSRRLQGSGKNEADRGRVEIRCADEGSGVDDEHLEHLFEPFYRADRSRSRETGASGLGLMIVARAIEAHGGRVGAGRGDGGGLVIIFDVAAG